MTTTTPYKALIFDLGKVIFDLSFERVFEHWSGSSGISTELIRERFDFNDLYEKFEIAAISPTEFRAGISAQLGFHISDSEFDEGWCDLYLEPYEGIDDLLNKLKTSYRMVALTNTNSIHYQIWPGKYEPILRHFETIYCSHLIFKRKPNADCYQEVLDHLDLKASECLFLDDNPKNIEGAENLGLKSILVNSFEGMVEALKALGVSEES